MNKADLVNLVAARTELTKTDVSMVVDAAIETITRLLDRAALSSGRKISVAMAKEALQSAGILPIVPPDPSSVQRE